MDPALERVMDPPELIQFLDLDALPLGIAIVVLGMLLAELGARSLGNVGERFNDRRLLVKRVKSNQHVCDFTVDSVDRL